MKCKDRNNCSDLAPPQESAKCYDGWYNPVAYAIKIVGSCVFGRSVCFSNDLINTTKHQKQQQKQRQKQKQLPLYYHDLITITTTTTTTTTATTVTIVICLSRIRVFLFVL